MHPLIHLLRPSLSLDDGLALLRAHESSIDRTLSGQLCLMAHQFIPAASSRRPTLIEKILGGRRRGAGDLATAEKFYRWAVAVGETIGNAQAVAYCSHDLAELLENLKKPAEAAEFYHRAVPHYFERGDVKEIISIHGRAALCYRKAGRTQAAISELRQGEQAAARGGFENSLKLNLYPLLIELLSAERRVEESRSAVKALATARQKIGTIDRNGFQRAIHLAEQGKIKESLELFRGGEAALRANGDRVDQASVLLNIGGLLSDAADFDKATETLREARGIYARIGNKDGEAKARKNLASNYEDQGFYQAALDEYRRALGLFQGLGETEAAGRTLSDLGVLHKNMNLLMDALRYYVTARHVFTERTQSESLRDVLGNLDTIFTKISVRLSPRLAEEASALLRRGALIDLARLLETGSSPWRAEGDVRVVPASSEEESPGVPVTRGKGGADHLATLARAYLAADDVKKAVQEMWSAASTLQYFEREYGRAVDLFYEAGSMCETHGLNHSLISIGQHLGACLAQAGRLAEAREVLEETVAESQSRNLFPVLWQARSELSDVLRRLGRNREAAGQMFEAIEEVEERASSFNHVGKAEAFLADKMTLYQRLVELLVTEGDAEAAYDVVLRAKSSTFVKFSERIRRAGPPALTADLRRSLDEARSDTEEFARGEQADAPVSGARWLFQCEELRIWMEACEEHWGRSPHAGRKVFNLRTIRERLDSASVIIDLFFTATRLYIFTITRGTFRCTPVEVTQREIFKELADCGFLHTISGRRGLYAVPQVHALLSGWFGRYFKTLTAGGRFSKFCLCPHGILHLLPLASAIHETETKSARLNCCWYVPHASSFKRSDGPRGKTDFSYLGVGTTGQGLSAPSEEVLNASRCFEKGRQRMFTDGSASRDVILSEMRDADVIHFACHGFLRDDISELSYLQLGEHEHLRAVDILSRGHTKARLVVLSACWTSVGRVSTSDEIVSLARAFLYVGAGAVLATLWPIPDKQTADLVNDFFRLWVREQNPLRVAFNLAQRLHRSHPVASSAFVLTER